MQSLSSFGLCISHSIPHCPASLLLLLLVFKSYELPWMTSNCHQKWKGITGHNQQCHHHLKTPHPTCFCESGNVSITISPSSNVKWWVFSPKPLEPKDNNISLCIINVKRDLEIEKNCISLLSRLITDPFFICNKLHAYDLYWS